MVGEKNQVDCKAGSDETETLNFMSQDGIQSEYIYASALKDLQLRWLVSAWTLGNL